MNLTILPNLFSVPLRDTTNKKAILPQQKYQNLAPLAQDTVSFTAKKQIAEKVTEFADLAVKKSKQVKKGQRLTVAEADDVVKSLEPDKTKLEKKLYEYFGDLVADEKHPNRPIALIKVRIKDKYSVAEKGGGRKCQNREEIIENVQDLIGARLVLRDITKDTFKEILKRFEATVNDGTFNINEIENYYAAPHLSYVTEKMLSPLSKTIYKKIGAIKIKSEQHPMGYNALHLTLKLPKNYEARYTEMQIMGEDVALLKYIEDLCYKYSNGKNLPDEYTPLKKYLAPLRGDDTTLKNAFKEYTRQAYIHQRRRNTIPFGEDKTCPPFLDIPWFLPKELDFKFLYREAKKCKAKAERKLQLEKIAKAETKNSAKKATKTNSTNKTKTNNKG